MPGGLVMGLTCSLASRDLHEVLYEELEECSFPNNMNPGDTVGAVTFIKSLEEHVSGDIECINTRTIGKHSFTLSLTLSLILFKALRILM